MNETSRPEGSPPRALLTVADIRDVLARVVGTADVKDAMRIARGRFDYPSSYAPKYFGGILKRRLAAADGRLVQCTVCGKDVVLNADQDPHLEWHHAACESPSE